MTEFKGGFPQLNNTGDKKLFPKSELEDIKTSPQYLFFWLTEVITGERGEILTSLRKWLRTVDDIIDNEYETPTPQGIDVQEYIRSKTKLVKDFSGESQSNEVFAEKDDAPLARALKIARRFGIEITSELLVQMDLFKTEFEKRGNKDFLVESRVEMFERAKVGDRVIVDIILKILGVRNPASLPLISMGIGQQLDWLADMRDDISNGLITIPREDVESFGIDLSKISEFTTFSPDKNFKTWYMEIYNKIIIDWQKAQKEDAVILREAMSSKGYLLFWNGFWKRAINLRLKIIQANIRDWFGVNKTIK